MESKVASWFNLWCLDQLVEQQVADGALLCRLQGEEWQPVLAAGVALPEVALQGLHRGRQPLRHRQCRALQAGSGYFLSLSPCYPGYGLLFLWQRKGRRLPAAAWLRLFRAIFSQHDRARIATRSPALLDHLPLPLLKLSPTGAILWSNHRLQQALGFTPAELEGKSASYLTHAADWPDSLRLYQRLGQEPGQGMATLEKRYLHKSGQVFRGRMHLTLVPGEQGRPDHIIGLLEGLERQRQDEIGFQTSQVLEQFRPEGLMICDASTRILAVNPAFERITGYTAGEVIGRFPSLLKSGMHAKGFYQAMNAALREHGCWQGEVWNRRKNGQVYPEFLRISTLRQRGRVRQYLAVFSDISHVKPAEQRQRTEEDGLTGLANRASFQHRLSQYCRRREPFALMILDINNFRLFNNAMNHRVGDRVLREVALRLQSRLRGDDFLARIGSDEFAVLVPGIVQHRQARIFGKHLLGALKRPLHLAEQHLYVDATLGGALWPGAEEEDAESLLQQAEQALFGAKQKKQPLALYDRQLNRVQSRRLRLQHELVEAIKQGGLSLHYQPIVAAETGGISKLEALVRWRHPTLGYISPAEFVPVAEECGMVQALGDWVLNRACTDLRRLHQAGYALDMAINRSSLEFQSLGLDGGEWLSVIQQQGLSPRHIIFEITESLFMQGNEQHLERIRALREAGCRIAIDDFGTGYSALNYLRTFPIDLVKIDKSFIDHLPGNRRDGLLLEGILRIIGDLGMSVVIEGMETEAQAAYLAAQPCHYLQGYLIARPLAIRELLPFLESYAGHSVPDTD
ncbi:putative bifunctional diguanylate cyclase/phosphodiesterase [Zobellella iuensis]|uniref:EAL domain-containing protein n=1 Tax=Zobellella iuensis TaxID=2803811 RepID=A0ABS1QW33_9GAMM|nr:bifunctional diguanylate cyclase/phosphodiesterase [Zobellella iuensis]MBL1379078.1 EAL domain-containing protein [Zobellella iuensis]